MSQGISRRGFLKESALLSVAVAATRATAGVAAEGKPAALPTIRLGNLEVSRLILGSNPFFGYAHQPGDVGKQMVAWFTPEHIMELLDQAADLGITAVTAAPDPKWIDLLHGYLDKGGKLKTWIAQCHGSWKKMDEEIARAAKGGAKAIFIQGHRVEEQFDQGKMDVLRGWMERIKKNYGLECRDRAIETIHALAKKPVVAYKILGAGRLEPKAAFAHAFANIAAKDGVCVGIYPEHNPGMLAQDVALVLKA